MKKKKYFIFAFVVLVILTSVGVFTVKSKYNHNEIDKENLGIEKDFKVEITSPPINSETIPEPEVVDISGIKNIALFGLDRRSSSEKSTRSDSIMVATVNFDTKEIKLTSFMRDMLVDIEGKGPDKLNHAYAYGGPELAIRTLNENFGLNIDDYVAVDFLMLEDIINGVGGVQIEIDKEEKELINKYMYEITKKNNKKFVPLEKYGDINLNGAQAVAYSRIRKHGNGDYERTERQREVLSGILNKLSSAKVTELPSLANTILKNTETSITELEALKLAKDYLLSDFSELKTSRIPRDGSFTTGIAPNGAWIMKVDFNKEKEYLKEWVFNSKPAVDYIPDVTDPTLKQKADPRITELNEKIKVVDIPPNL